MTMPTSNSPPRRRLRVTIIGAGVSGILMGVKLTKHLSEHVTFQIFEKSAEPGGTWFENRYPGCACDVPSHLYQFSFAVNTEWRGFYATSPEIQDYLKRVIAQYDLNKFITYNSLVNHAGWDGARGLWKIQIQNTNSTNGVITETEIESEILINAGGILNNPFMPDIPGLDTFGGPILHTAAWDDSVNLTGKRIAIIGAGASAVQVLPAIQPIANHVDVYIRTPSWISPPVALPEGVEKGHIYREEEKTVFRTDKEAYLTMRKGLEDQFNGMFGAFRKDGTEQDTLRARFERRMKELIQDEELQRRLIPGFGVGCRRINPGEEYLVSLQEKNVRPVFEGIREVVPGGIMTRDGEVNEADVLIAATGFNTSFRPRFPIVGVDGVNLQNLWATNPVSYFGIAVSGFPNYLMFLGPNTPISNGSLMGPLEATSDYIIRLLRKVLRQHIKSFNIHQSVQDDFDRHTQNYMQDMVWTGPCRSWFKNNETGKVTALWPGSSLHYMQTLAEDRWEDYQWEYMGNRFEYMGRGRSWIEDPEEDRLGRDESDARWASTVPSTESDLSFYLDNKDSMPLALSRPLQVVGDRKESVETEKARI